VKGIVARKTKLLVAAEKLSTLWTMSWLRTVTLVPLLIVGVPWAAVKVKLDAPMLPVLPVGPVLPVAPVEPVEPVGPIILPKRFQPIAA
jgi:hypothetical protein